MLKSFCCNDTYLGINESLLKKALAERVLTNGQIIPCLTCRTIYEISNFQLLEVGKLSLEASIVLMREAAEMMLGKILPKPEVRELTPEEELSEIYKEFKLPKD